MRSRAVIQGRGDQNLPGWPAVGPKKKEEVRNAQGKAGSALPGTSPGIYPTQGYRRLE